VSLLADIESQLSGQGSQPPLHLWKPALSGDMDIRIRANGDWYHDGELIQRHALVKLFASILRREDDNHYYLVTPVEKWRIQVDDAPFIITAMDIVEAGTSQQTIVFTSNVGRLYPLGPDYRLIVEGTASGDEPAPYLSLDNGLRAKLNRPVFYQLVALAKPAGNILRVYSKQLYFDLGSFE
jgi:hypothetical protein